MTIDIKLGTVQSRLITMLGDGQPHTRKELHNCSSQGRNGSVKLYTIDYHICVLRKKLRLASEGKDHVLTIVPVEPAVEPTFRLVKVFPATLADVGLQSA